jgi:hypothetical protein
MKYNLPEAMGNSKHSARRKVYSHEYVHKLNRETSLNDLMLHLKALEKQEEANPISSTRKEIIIIIRVKLMRERQNVHRIDETKNLFFKKLHKIDKSLVNLTKRWSKMGYHNKYQ